MVQNLRTSIDNFLITIRDGDEPHPDEDMLDVLNYLFTYLTTKHDQTYMGSTCNSFCR